jgi:PAS domain S-box-containing protein
MISNQNQTLPNDTFLDKWDWNIQSNSINISPSFKAIFGYADHELPGTIETWIKLILPEDFTIVQKHINKHIETRGSEPFNSKVRLSHKNGAMHVITLTGRVIEWYKNSPLRMVGQHIIDKQLLQSNGVNLTQDVSAETNYEARRTGRWDIDLITNSINWDSVSKDMHEVEQSYQPKIDTAFTFFSKDSREDIKTALKSAVNYGTSFEFEYEMMTAKGRKQWTRINGNVVLYGGKPVKIKGTFEDIDYFKKKKQVEVKITEGQRMNNYVGAMVNVDVTPAEYNYSSVFNKLSEKAPNAVFQYQQFIDGTGKFPYSSRTMYDLFEVKPEEIKFNAAKVFERIHPEDIGTVKGLIEQSIEDLCSVELEYRVNLPLKGMRWLKGIMNPQRLSDGSVLWHGYVKDITELKTKEIERFNMFKIVTKQNYQLINFSYKYLQLMMMTTQN